MVYRVSWLLLDDWTLFLDDANFVCSIGQLQVNLLNVRRWVLATALGTFYMPDFPPHLTGHQPGVTAPDTLLPHVSN